MQLHKHLCFAIVGAAMLAAPNAYGQEKIKMAVGQGIPFDTAIPVAAVKAGIFKKHGLDVDLIITSGGGETLQAVISGSVDVGIAAGTTGVLGAFSKGAPVRIISSTATGAGDTFIYVPANSPIKSASEIDGKTVAFSTVGASTYSTVTGIANHYKVKPKFVPTGSIPATYSTTMSGQVDVGWGAVPFGIQERRDGKIRVLAWGTDAARINNQTVRVNITHERVLNERKETLRKFMVAYYEAVEWGYSSNDVLKIISDTFSIPADIIDETRKNHTTRQVTQLGEVKGIADSMQDAIEFKYMAAPLNQDQLARLLQLDAVRPASAR
jgi:NitT/TauT family transport system substrate-binding protein